MPILRLKGHYFAIATLGVAETMREIVYNLKITGGGTGLMMPITKSALPFFYLMLGILLLATLVNWWLSASRFGYGLIAIREDEDAAAAMGINTPLYKTIAFAMSGGFAGLVGGVFAYWITFIDPDGVFKVIIDHPDDHHGGVRRHGHRRGAAAGRPGARLGVRAALHAAGELAELFNGLIVILVVLFMPKGLAEVIRKRQFSLRDFARNLREYRI